MFERSHVNVKFEPRSTLKKKKAQDFISCLYFIDEIKMYVLLHERKKITRQWKSTLRGIKIRM